MNEKMSKRTRQYAGILAAMLCYYIVHEGAHCAAALCMGVFRRVNLMGLGVQVDVFRERMTDGQLGLFCLAGAIATLVAAGLLVLAAPGICRAASKVFRACAYYTTMAFLLVDPLYLSVLCGLFGGGDMNGIALLCPEPVARAGFGALLLINAGIFMRLVLPQYRASFAGEALRR